MTTTLLNHEFNGRNKKPAKMELVDTLTLQHDRSEKKIRKRMVVAVILLKREIESSGRSFTKNEFAFYLEIDHWKNDCSKLKKKRNEISSEAKVNLIMERIVESVGKGVTDLAPGDVVLPIFTGECGECVDCKSEESNLCRLLRVFPDREVMISDGKSRFSINGKTIYHFLGSTFSQYTVVPAGCVAKIHPLAPLEKVFILGCGISTGLGAVLNVAKPFEGSTVAIFGLGTIGLAAAEGARLSKASRIIGIDINPRKFDQAKKFGVMEFVNPKDYDKPIQEILVEMTDGGVDRSIECTGNVDAMVSAFECVRSGWGVAVLVGLPPKNAVLKLNPAHFMMDSKAIKGTTFGDYKPRSDLPILVEKCMNKELELEKFLTHDVQFSDINKAFEYLHKGESLRCRIRMDA